MTASSKLKLDGAFYQHFQALLEDEIPDCSAAEAQGVLTGLTCAGETESSHGSWQTLLIDADGADSAHNRAQDALSALMALINKALRGDDFTFRPLLPPDTAPIATRAQAMADWCHGFGLGLQWNGLIDPETLEPDARDAIVDISELAQADAGSADSDDENALTELEEYLRVATQLIFEAAQPPTPAQPTH